MTTARWCKAKAMALSPSFKFSFFFSLVLSRPPLSYSRENSLGLHSFADDDNALQQGKSDVKVTGEGKEEGGGGGGGRYICT